jgi:rhamnulokinase
MADRHHFLALDLGAESGRGEVVTLCDGKVTMEEVHRFPSRNVQLGPTRHWDFPATYAEVLQAMRVCAARGVKLSSISVDTWGVDFGLLGPDGGLLGNPVHYRDSRTDGIHAHAAKIMPIEEIFAATALHTMPINTLFQLHAMQRAGSPLLGVAETFLMIPDLFNYFLTGVKVCELSDAQTSQLIGTDCKWSELVIGRFGLPRGIFPRLVEPATVLGPMTAAVQAQVGLGDVPVVACASHDTSAAVAAVPASGTDWAFLSCGTWSILGRMLDQPIATRECYETGFTNEYTYGGWYLARNILGLWLVQELRRKWDTKADPWDYTRMTAEAAAAASGPLVNVDDGRLLAPADMEQALLTILRQTGQPTPAGRGQLLRCVLESLALQYAWGLDTIGHLAGRRPGTLYIVGGGIANKLLCQLTANACGVPVQAGADQCTALGNALGAALGLGILKSKEQIREVMRASSEITTYEPQDPAVWADKRAQYKKLQGSHKWG